MWTFREDCAAASIFGRSLYKNRAALLRFSRISGVRRDASKTQWRRARFRSVSRDMSTWTAAPGAPAARRSVRAAPDWWCIRRPRVPFRIRETWRWRIAAVRATGCLRRTPVLRNARSLLLNRKSSNSRNNTHAPSFFGLRNLQPPISLRPVSFSPATFQRSR